MAHFCRLVKVPTDETVEKSEGKKVGISIVHRGLKKIVFVKSGFVPKIVFCLEDDERVFERCQLGLLLFSLTVRSPVPPNPAPPRPTGPLAPTGDNTLAAASGVPSPALTPCLSLALPPILWPMTTPYAHHLLPAAITNP